MRTDQRTSARQWLWFFGMWLMGVLTVGGGSALIRALFALVTGA